MIPTAHMRYVRRRDYTDSGRLESVLQQLWCSTWKMNDPPAEHPTEELIEYHSGEWRDIPIVEEEK